MKKYRALIVDVDGTLIPNRADGMPSKKVIDAINKASSKIHIGVATARPMFLLSEIFKKIKLSGPSIIHGGAQVVDLTTGKILWEQLLTYKDILRASKIFKKFKVSLGIADNEKDIVFSENYKPIKPFEMFVIGEDSKVIEKLVKEASKIETLAVHTTPSWEGEKVGLVITPAQATKQHGIFEVAKILKIDTKEIIGIGDGYNDFPLLMACGLKVAMGNADKELKEIADYIAPTVEEDGVADVIEKFVI